MRPNTTSEQLFSAGERRAHTRLRLSSITYVEVGEGNGGIVLNLGIGGLAFQAIAKLHDAETLVLKLRLPNTRQTAEISGHVAWLGTKRNQGGIVFDNLSAAVREIIADWIAEQQQLYDDAALAAQSSEKSTLQQAPSPTPDKLPAPLPDAAAPALPPTATPMAQPSVGQIHPRMLRAKSAPAVGPIRPAPERPAAAVPLPANPAPLPVANPIPAVNTAPVVNTAPLINAAPVVSPASVASPTPPVRAGAAVGAPGIAPLPVAAATATMPASPAKPSPFKAAPPVASPVAAAPAAASRTTSKPEQHAPLPDAGFHSSSQPNSAVQSAPRQSASAADVPAPARVAPIPAKDHSVPLYAALLAEVILRLERIRSSRTATSLRLWILQEWNSTPRRQRMLLAYGAAAGSAVLALVLIFALAHSAPRQTAQTRIRPRAHQDWGTILKELFLGADDPTKPALDEDQTGVQVWISPGNGFYYCSGSPYFQTLQPGRLMTQGQALQSGYQPKLGSFCEQ